jgi:hypothetical protein
MLTADEISALVGSYRLGCVITGKLPDNDVMLDLINTAKAIRSLHVLINLVIQGNLPVQFEDHKLTIVCDKASSIKSEIIEHST